MAKKVFNSTYGTSMRRLVGATKVKDLKLEVDDSDYEKTLLNGKAFVQAPGSSTESCETFEFASTDIKDVRRDEYQGSEAIVIEATVEIPKITKSPSQNSAQLVDAKAKRHPFNGQR